MARSSHAEQARIRSIRELASRDLCDSTPAPPRLGHSVVFHGPGRFPKFLTTSHFGHKSRRFVVAQNNFLSNGMTAVESNGNE